jgi:predicted glycosyltransferase
MDFTTEGDPMRIHIDVGHPAHVHLYRNFIKSLSKKAEFLITARNKDVTIHLLNAYGIPYEIVDGKSNNVFLEWGKRTLRVYKLSKKFSPTYLMGLLNPAIAFSSFLLRRPAIIFNDSEPEAIKLPIADKITAPLVDVIIVPESLRHSYGKKEVRVASYKELAYLHPNYFKPDFKKLSNAGITKDEEFVLLRFVAWRAYHDIGEGGFSYEHKLKLIKELSEYATVFISSENPLPKELEKYRIPIPPEDIHHFLYYAKLLVCDSQTITTEAGILGTPAIRSNSFVGAKDMGNFIELEKKYRLVFNIRDPDKAIEKAVSLINQQGLKRIWSRKREKLLKDK